MKIISRYLAKTVVSNIFLVILVLLGIEIFIEFTREFPDLGNGSYNLLQVMSFVPMILPADIYRLFPMAGLLGTIIGLGILASSSELIIIRSCGVSLTKITLSIFKTALILSLIMLFIGEGIAPILQHKAVANKTIAISNGEAFLTQKGLWLKDGNNFIHINQVLDNGYLQGITRYNFSPKNNILNSISFAEKAEYKNNVWLFQNITQTNLDQDNNSTNSTTIEQDEWNLKLKPRLLSLSSTDNEQKSLSELYHYITYRKQSGLTTTNDEFTFWQRIFQPLATLVMMLLAIPFVFGPLRSATMGLRMLAGVVVGFTFYIINQFIGPFSIVYQIPPILASFLPIVIFAFGGWYFMRKV